MLPTPQTLVAQIRDGTLLPSAVFADLDCDAILDARDSTAQFEQEWLTAREDLAARWKALRPKKVVRAAVEDLRQESFLAASTATNQHELASYVSDDFELIAWALAVGHLPSVVDWLWKCYSTGTVPNPHDLGRSRGREK